MDYPVIRQGFNPRGAFKLALAWVIGFVGVILFTWGFQIWVDWLGDFPLVSSPVFAPLVVAAIWVLSVVGTPLVARAKGRRWWLWLILGASMHFVALFTVWVSEDLA